MLSIEPLPGPLGAEIRGLDLGSLSSDAQGRQITAALAEHQLLVARGTKLGPEAFCELANALGTPTVHPIFPHLPGFPPVVEVVNLGPELKATSIWHSDVTFEEQPPAITLLSAQVLPPGKGNTLFADQQAAFDALDPEYQNEIEGLTAEHLGAGAALLTGASTAPSVVHPVVRTHPVTGRRSIFVNDAFTTQVLGMNAEQGRDLVSRLVHHGTREEFVHTHVWQPDDLVLWDNRSTLHFHVHDYGWDERRLLRITLKGDSPR